MKRKWIICCNCKVPLEIIKRSNGACDDPACCGDREDWAEIKCPKCKKGVSTRYEEEVY